MMIKLLVAVILVQIFGANGDDMGFVFNGFGANISLDGAAAITDGGMLRLTSDTTYNQIGHAFYYRPLPLRDPSTNSSFSFSTMFVIQLVPRSNDYSGNGMAFVISPAKDLSGGQAGGYLGFLNSTNNGKSSNHIVAIEFDRVPNPEFNDPDFNHVGIDINSVISINLSRAGYYRNMDGKFVDLSLWSGKPLQVWIDYNADKRQLSVKISPFDVSKPNRSLVSSSIDLSGVLLDSMYVGFSAAINYIQTSHYVLGWSFKVNGQADQLDLNHLPRAPKISGPSSSKKWVIIIVCVAVILLIIIAGVAFFVRRRRRIRRRGLIIAKSPSGSEAGGVNGDKSPGQHVVWNGPRRYTYEDVRAATNNFNNLLGQGGSGKVYKGVMPNSGDQVAVKVIPCNSSERIREFVSEITIIGNIRHENLVRLQGYSDERELILVYDFMPNGSLEKKLPALSWTKRFQIIKQVAAALCFLHQQMNEMIVHRDIKSSNVLLDDNFNEKLGDFGLSRRYDHGAVPYTINPAGTAGYIAPEVGTGTVRTETDVYAFGILMLEIASGKSPTSNNVNLNHWVTECFSEGGTILDVVDQSLESNFLNAEMKLVLRLGLLCSSHSMSSRPTMQEVVQDLNVAPDQP